MTRKFVVATDVYGRGFGLLRLELIEADTLDELATQLGWEGINDDDQASPWQSLLNGHGDGADYYKIKELVDGKLVPVPGMED